MRRVLVLVFATLLSISCVAQTKEAVDKYKKALREMESPRANPDKVEKLLRESLKASPDYLDAQRELGNLFNVLHRYDSASEEYKKAKALDDQQKKLSRAERDALLDDLGVTLAQGRHYDEAISVYKSALAEHAEYALFEYNLACTYAEKGDLDSALPHLSKSWELRDTIPRGQQFPDPRKDQSFRKFWDDPRFQRTVENMVV